MRRWIVGVSILALLDLLLVVKLNQWFDVKILVLIYLGSTVLGFMLLYMFRDRGSSSGIPGKKRQKTLKLKLATRQPLTEPEMNILKKVLGIAYYSLAFVLIMLPGLITDIFGMLIMIPMIFDWFLNRGKLDYKQQAKSTDKESNKSAA